jgi:glycosyltransferase involved in cell wall biosynthesis
MHDKSRTSFAFLVLAYNHEHYILEHLESIKYLVLTYGNDIDVDLIINDDCSSDRTQNLVDEWLLINASLFRFVKTIYNPKNIGTCASVSNMLSNIVADRCKLTAGDDVYSFENIFALTIYGSKVAMLSGRTLFLHGDSLGMDILNSLLVTATQVIYEKKHLMSRFKHFSSNNAPNILYATECLLHPEVRTQLQLYDVTEDWPLQVAIARQFPEYQFELLNEVLVYYRRTIGSTYIVASQRFIKDKINMYNYLIANENNWIERIRLRSRRYCFGINGKILKKIINIDFYFFAIHFIMHIKTIWSHEKKVNIDIEKHQRHYLSIRNNSDTFKLTYRY